MRVHQAKFIVEAEADSEITGLLVPPSLWKVCQGTSGKRI